jgi:hypothetical protein
MLSVQSPWDSSLWQMYGKTDAVLDGHVQTLDATTCLRGGGDRRAQITTDAKSSLPESFARQSAARYLRFATESRIDRSRPVTAQHAKTRWIADAEGRTGR